MNENTQYWINQNGIQTGPHTIDQLKEMELTGNAYVWRAGMADWKPITAVDELNALVALQPAPELVESEAIAPVADTVATVSPNIPPIPQQPVPVQQP